MDATDRITVVVGLQAEARLIHPLGWDVAVGGGSAAGAEAAARSAIAQGASALVSFGLAGGLDPALDPGTLLVPGSVQAAGHRLPTDPALSARLGGVTGHCLLGAAAIVAQADDKRRLFAETSAAAVDLESGAVAQVAAEHALPFAVLRAVCDPAWRSLPPAALWALNARGGIGIGRVVFSVLADFGQLPDLLALARDAAAARRALRRRVAAIRA
ncbi:MAG TPA: hypothetical protein VFN42_00635 [Acetobacteraceae bacterium]|nr:hypothetical protein [Acetobacteraceae bacterium]